MRNEKTFLKIITYAPLFLIPLFVFTIIVASYQVYSTGFDSSVEDLKKDLLKSKKEAVENKVKNLSKIIVYQKSRIQKELISRVKGRVETAHTIAYNIYDEYKDTKSDEEIKDIINSTLKTFSWNENEGYIWVMDYFGMHYVLENKKYLKGNSFIDFQDAQGRYIVQEEIAICKEKGEGYLWDTFTKPEKNDNKQYKQVAFVKAFKPYNWCLGSAEFLDTATKKTNKFLFDIVKQVDEMGGHYIYIINGKGNFLVHNKLPQLVGEEIEITNELVLGTIEQARKLIENKENITFVYDWHNSSTNEIEKKFAYLQRVPNTDWLISSGFFLSEVENQLAKQKVNMLKIYNKNTENIFYVAILIILASLVLSFFVSKKIRKRFSEYELRIGRKTKELHELNISLEEKVHKRTLELTQSKKRLDEVFEASDEGIWDWNIETNHVEHNDKWYEILGLSDDKDLIEDFTTLIHPEDKENVLKKMENTLSGNSDNYRSEHRLFKKNGEVIWVIDKGRIVQRDEDGKAVRMAGSFSVITKRKEIENELREQKNILDYQAHHDALTKLPNRVLFHDRLQQAIQKAKRNNTKVALLFIDLDHFKEINDSLGHDIGDKILKEVAHRLQKSTRGEDTVARLGGDEFTVVLEDLHHQEDASSISSKILDSLSKFININDHTLYVTTSIGISIYPDDGKSTQNLLKYADSAMYKAKDEGRNNFQYYNSTMTELAFERVVMETSLRSALKNEEFIVYYQPQVNGTTDTITGMEALVRWQHPTMGLVSPDKFIPLAESTGLIVDLDRYVMRTAMTQIVQWYKEGLNPGVLAMNLAVKQLQKEDFIPMFKELMKETDCKPEWIELEVTEGQIMTHPEEAIVKLKEISDLGIELAVDDFGTGYSSLAYLKRLPIDKLKIDQAFVRNLPDDEEDAGIAKAVIALANSLNLKVIAEGVETKEQRDFLIENGCKKIQGYFYSKPVPADELKSILKDGL